MYLSKCLFSVAHSEVYGYGFRPYEYLPPPGSATINVTSELRAEEVKRGMYSLRSFLLPKLLAAVLYTATYFIPNVSPYLVSITSQLFYCEFIGSARDDIILLFFKARFKVAKFNFKIYFYTLTSVPPVLYFLFYDLSYFLTFRP